MRSIVLLTYNVGSGRPTKTTATNETGGIPFRGCRLFKQKRIQSSAPLPQRPCCTSQSRESSQQEASRQEATPHTALALQPHPVTSVRYSAVASLLHSLPQLRSSQRIPSIEDRKY